MPRRIITSLSGNHVRALAVFCFLVNLLLLLLLLLRKGGFLQLGVAEATISHLPDSHQHWTRLEYKGTNASEATGQEKGEPGGSVRVPRSAQRVPGHNLFLMKWKQHGRQLRAQGCVVVGGICPGPLSCCPGAICRSHPTFTRRVPRCFRASQLELQEEMLSSPPLFESGAYRANQLWFTRRPRVPSRSV